MHITSSYLKVTSRGTINTHWILLCRTEWFIDCVSVNTAGTLHRCWILHLIRIFIDNKTWYESHHSLSVFSVQMVYPCRSPLSWLSILLYTCARYIGMLGFCMFICIDKVKKLLYCSLPFPYEKTFSIYFVLIPYIPWSSLWSSAPLSVLTTCGPGIDSRVE